MGAEVGEYKPVGSKAASILVLGSVTHEVLLAQNSPYGSLVPIRGRLARRLLQGRKR